MTMMTDWPPLPEEEYVPQYNAHVYAAYYSLHNAHVKFRKDMLDDIAAEKMGLKIIRPRYRPAGPIAVQPMVRHLPTLPILTLENP